MLIYSDGPLSGKNLTPAHTYVYQTDFAKILEDIEKGIIPCGSGQPFPVEFENPAEAIGDMNSGWNEPAASYNGGNNYNGFLFGPMT